MVTAHPNLISREFQHVQTNWCRRPKPVTGRGAMLKVLETPYLSDDLKDHRLRLLWTCQGGLRSDLHRGPAAIPWPTCNYCAAFFLRNSESKWQVAAG